jgi:hypothetical protein
MYGLWPVPFNDGCAVASMDMSTEYEVILLTSEGTIWDRAGQAGAEQAAEKVFDCEKSEAKSRGIPHLAKNERDTPNFLYAALERTACAALFRESRRKFREPTKLHRKSRIWGTQGTF